MKKAISIICVLLALCLTAGAVPALAAGDTVTLALSGSAVYSDAFAMLDKVNEQREKNGLAPLTMDVEMLNAAMQRSAELALCYQMARPDGSRWTTALPQKFDATKRGQNVYAGTESAEQVVELLMNSQSHRNTMMDSEYKSMGVGCFMQGSYIYWVQLFSSAEGNAARRRDDSVKTRFRVTADTDNMDFGLKVESNTDKAYPRLRLFNTSKGFPKEEITLDSDGLTFASADPRAVYVLEDGYFVSFKAGETNVTCQIGSTPLVTVRMTSSGATAVMGDADGNGKVENTDLVLTARYVVGYKERIFTRLCDFDDSGAVDNLDLVTLARLMVS